MLRLTKQDAASGDLGMISDPAMLGQTPHDRNPGDRYFTEPWVTQALVDRVKFRGTIWEPACGRGDMVKVLVGAGYMVVSSDIANRISVDFLGPHHCGPIGLFSIITNPPYTLAEAFIHKALEFTKSANSMVAMLMRNEYDCAASRRNLFEHPVFAKKLVLTKRPHWIDTGHTASPRHNLGPPTHRPRTYRVVTMTQHRARDFLILLFGFLIGIVFAFMLDDWAITKGYCPKYTYPEFCKSQLEHPK